MANRVNLSLPDPLKIRNTDSLLMLGLFTLQVTLGGYAVPALTLNNTTNKRKVLVIKNISDPTVAPTQLAYWGGSGVTILTGIPISPGELITFDFSIDKWIDVYITGTIGVVVAIGELL